jgi:hypothetical protein
MRRWKLGIHDSNVDGVVSLLRSLSIPDVSVTVRLKRPYLGPAGFFANFDVRRRTHKRQA